MSEEQEMPERVQLALSILETYSEGFAPITAWSTGDLIELVRVIEEELQTRAEEINLEMSNN